MPELIRLLATWKEQMYVSEKEVTEHEILDLVAETLMLNEAQFNTLLDVAYSAVAKENSAAKAGGA